MFVKYPNIILTIMQELCKDKPGYGNDSVRKNMLKTSAEYGMIYWIYYGEISLKAKNGLFYG